MIEVEISPVTIVNTAESRPETSWISEKVERVWVAKKRVSKAGGAQTLQWTDSRACYQLVETLATLVDLDHLDGAPVASVDAVGGGKVYRIEAAGLSVAGDRPAQVRLTSGKDAPATAVVDAALKAWSPCWSDTPPTLSARP